MSEPTLEQVKKILTSNDINTKKHKMSCTFTCPETGKEFTGSAMVQQPDDSIAGKAMSVGKATLLTKVKMTLARTVGRFFGGGLLGGVVAGVAMTAAEGATQDLAYSDEDKDRAIMMSFKQVEDRFVWNEEKKTLMFGEKKAEDVKEKAPDFMAIIGGNPVESKSERELLARLLVKLSAIDGHIDDEEKELMKAFVGEEFGTIDELLEKGAPDKDQLKEMGKDRRPSVLTVMWALAYCDEDLDDAETAFITETAEKFEVGSDELGKLQQAASRYIVQQAIAASYPEGKKDYESHGKAMELADKFGIAADDAKEIDKNYRAAVGIM